MTRYLLPILWHVNCQALRHSDWSREPFHQAPLTPRCHAYVVLVPTRIRTRGYFSTSCTAVDRFVERWVESRENAESVSKTISSANLALSTLNVHRESLGACIPV